MCISNIDFLTKPYIYSLLSGSIFVSFYLTKAVLLNSLQSSLPNNSSLDNPISVIRYLIDTALWIMGKLYDK